jgi:hypothetical protein
MPRNLQHSFNDNAGPSSNEVDAFVRDAAGGNYTKVSAFADKYPGALNSPNIHAYIRKTALMAAAESGQKEIVELLLDRGAAVNFKTDYWSHTALYFAASAGRAEIVGLLIDKGADMGASEKKNGKWTPLMIATWHLHVDTVKTLLDKGAVLNDKNDRGETALDIAQKQLQNITADPNIAQSVKDDWTKKSLQIFALFERDQVVKQPPEPETKKRKPPAKKFSL